MISAKVIADSIAPNNKRITTLELEFPRIILAEQNTHRMLSRNSQSTRAIPLIRSGKVKQSALSLLGENPFVPVFTRNQSGMMSNHPVEGFRSTLMRGIWKTAMRFNMAAVWVMAKLGASKQHAGRLLEPFQYIRVICTATEFDNYFWLRNHEAAQPEIRELAQKMLEAMNSSNPLSLNEGDWHLPYFEDGVWTPENKTPLETAQGISASCTAQVSYRRLDASEDTANRVVGRLIQPGQPVHSSPFEHQATPAEYAAQVSGNLRGWNQFRSTIANNVCFEYDQLIRRLHESSIDQDAEWGPLLEKTKFDIF